MNNGRADQIIQCIGCKTEFVFSVGEQNFFEEHQLSPPKRCKPRRDQRREEKAKKEEGARC
jgi:hypothetical protein